MVRPKLPTLERLSKPIYVLLQPSEKRFVERKARAQKKSRGAVLRDAFRHIYRRELKSSE